MYYRYQLNLQKCNIGMNSKQKTNYFECLLNACYSQFVYANECLLNSCVNDLAYFNCKLTEYTKTSLSIYGFSS